VQHIWWAYPLYLFSVTPGLRRLWDWGYRAFRDNRYHVSAACRLPPAATSQPTGHARDFKSSGSVNRIHRLKPKKPLSA
jgi:hypothetical protein